MTFFTQRGSKRPSPAQELHYRLHYDGSCESNLSTTPN